MTNEEHRKEAERLLVACETQMQAIVDHATGRGMTVAEAETLLSVTGLTLAKAQVHALLSKD